MVPCGRQSGFNLGEVLIAIALVGTLAVLLEPMLNSNVGEDKLLNMARNSAGEVVLALNRLSRDQAIDSTTSATEIVNRLNYVRRIDSVASGAATVAAGQCSNNMCVTVGTVTDVSGAGNSGQCSNGTDPNIGASPSFAPACAVYVSPCNATTPCMLLQNGALLQYDANATFEGTDPDMDLPQHAMKFFFDPDGAGPQLAVSFVLFMTGRITTASYATTALYDRYDAPDPGAIAGKDDLPVGTSDPDYVSSWTNG